jgi:hypothetical protein
MFSPDQLYDYLRYYCHVNKKPSIVRSFTKNGSKGLYSLTEQDTPYISHIESPVYPGFIEMFDQEPVDIRTLYDASIDYVRKTAPNSPRLLLSVNDFVFSKSASLYTPIIAHSEINSNDVNAFINNFFVPLFFWSNAITSRYWFSHYELLQKQSYHVQTSRLGVYIRNTSGTREYRKKLLSFIKNKQPAIFCPFVNGDMTNITSDSSASIEWPDHNKFDIQLVPETIFETEKIHLTEKIFKPIVMHQSFILFAGAGSLRYLRNYGFKTFSGVWDESYDLETNSDIRYSKIITLINSILKLTSEEYEKLIAKTKKIIIHNREHFYSEKFKLQLLNELDNNLEEAIAKQEENFYKVPGGTLFHYYDIYSNLTNNLDKTLATNALKYITAYSPDIGRQIIKKYNHLF